MQIVYLKNNTWGNPTLQNWVPVVHNGSFKGMGVRLGRPDQKGEYPLELWLDLRAEGPEVQWSWFRNWNRPFLEQAELQDFGEISDVLALVGKSHEEFSADGVVLLVDLHSGKNPHRDLSERCQGAFIPATKNASRVFHLSQHPHYPVGALVIYPGYQATVQAEAAWGTYTLTYPSAEHGVYLIPQNPVLLGGPSVMGHYHAYGMGAWSQVASPFADQRE